MRKVISLALYGNDPKYNVGAIINSELSREFYPDWTCRFFVSQEVSDNIIFRLKSNGAEVYKRTRKTLIDGMFWRFTPCDDPDVEAVIVRDCDSRLSLREALAVNEWIESNKRFHIIRDHPWHISLIMGGTWGAKKGALPGVERLIRLWKIKRSKSNQGWSSAKGDDQEFLNQMVYPLIKDDVLIHSEFVRFDNEIIHPFPFQRNGHEFVGQVWNEHNETIQEHLDSLIAGLGHTKTYSPSELL